MSYICYTTKQLLLYHSQLAGTISAKWTIHALGRGEAR